MVETSFLSDMVRDFGIAGVDGNDENRAGGEMEAVGRRDRKRTSSRSKAREKQLQLQKKGRKGKKEREGG